MNSDGFAVTVSLREPVKDDVAETDTEAPQIWQLTVTKAGMPVTDLAGNTVRASFPFEAPEAWGNLAEIADDSLYAVFADENGVLTAYEAQYDSETGQVWFDAEQTGDFVIVRLAYEEEPYTEDFYRTLSGLEEIQSFLAVLEE